MSESNIQKIKKYHPCFSHEAHFKYGRIHLPVAPRCNIRCHYCSPLMDPFEDRPGVTEEILKPLEAMERLRDAANRDFPLSVVAVAGPGEPLANEETFEVLEMAKQEFPGLIRCLATNGLALAEKADTLKRLGVNTVTVTANTVKPEVGEKIYEYVKMNGSTHIGKEAAEILINHQQEGVKAAVALGMVVKINTVLIPEINGDHLLELAATYRQLGANIMNIMPLIPVGKWAHMRPPIKEEIMAGQDTCGMHLEQFRVCRQCRADACGIPAHDNGGMFSRSNIGTEAKMRNQSIISNEYGE